VQFCEMIGLDTFPHSDEPICTLASKPGLSQGVGSESFWWHLVWCHERCHKRESDALRMAVKEAAREAGGMLVCIKKANKFAMWLAETQRQRPFVLLTDWREVKPCTEAVTQLRPQGCMGPALTVVLAEESRQFERASTWAQGFLPHSARVQVCQDIGPPKAFVSMLANRLRGGSAPAAPQGRWAAPACPSTAWCGLVPNSVPETRFTALPANKMINSAFVHRGDEPDKASCGMDMPPHCGGALTRAPQLQLWKASDGCHHGAFATGAVSPVAQVLSPVYASGHSPSQIEQLLREAMPDHYDD